MGDKFRLGLVDRGIKKAMELLAKVDKDKDGKIEVFATYDIATKEIKGGIE